MPSNKSRKTATEEMTPSEPEAPKTRGRKSTNGPLLSEDAKAALDEWMRKWLAAAEVAETVDDVCEESSTPMSLYIHGRLGNTSFDDACLLLEQIMELRIRSKISRASLEGDARAQGLYFKEVSRPSFAPAFPSWNAPPPPAIDETPLPAQVAAAMIAAGLAAYEELPPPDGVKR